MTQLTLHEIPEEQEELKKFEPEELQSKNTEVVELELQAAQNSIKNTKPNLNAIQVIDKFAKREHEIRMWYVVGI